MAKQRGKTKQVYVNTVISDVQSQLPYHLPINSWNTRGIVGQLLQREREGGERERERDAFRKETVHDGNFVETVCCSIFLAQLKILDQDLRAEFRRIIVCLISSLSFNLMVSKRFPHHDSVCLSCLLTSKKNGTCPVSYCLANFTTLHFAFDNEGR